MQVFSLLINCRRRVYNSEYVLSLLLLKILNITLFYDGLMFDVSRRFLVLVQFIFCRIVLKHFHVKYFIFMHFTLSTIYTYFRHPPYYVCFVRVHTYSSFNHVFFSCVVITFSTSHTLSLFCIRFFNVHIQITTTHYIVLLRYTSKSEKKS